MVKVYIWPRIIDTHLYLCCSVGLSAASVGRVSRYHPLASQVCHQIQPYTREPWQHLWPLWEVSMDGLSASVHSLPLSLFSFFLLSLFTASSLFLFPFSLLSLSLSLSPPLSLPSFLPSFLPSSSPFPSHTIPFSHPSFSPSSFTRMFWRVVSHMNNTQRQQLLYFATGSATLPAATDTTDRTAGKVFVSYANNGTTKPVNHCRRKTTCDSCIVTVSCFSKELTWCHLV